MSWGETTEETMRKFHDRLKNLSPKGREELDQRVKQEIKDQNTQEAREILSSGWRVGRHID